MNIVQSAFILATTISFGVSLAYADQFTISQQITDNLDTVPPSVPLNLVADVLSSDQIDVSWDAATDNVSVTGYNVFRDGLAIATTTVTAYSDTGLAAGTTYVYNVRAFDGSDNVSALSATATATTDAITLTPEPAEGESESTSIGPLGISGLLITAMRDSVLLQWKTNRPARSVVSWGRGEELEMGSLAERSFAGTHDTKIAGLMPDTIYMVEIRGVDRHGIEVRTMKSIRTAPSMDTIAPSNVSLLGFTIDGDDVTLSWKNPKMDFDHVRIVRGDTGYPSDPYDGTLIYQGRDEAFTDMGALEGRDLRHYAVFAYDRAGNPASGAVVRASKEDIPLPIPEESPYASPLSLTDVIFSQGGKPIAFIGQEVEIDAGTPLTIEIPYERLPEHLKTIVVHLQDPEDPERTFSFLLRINADKSSYAATVDALSRNGTFPLVLQILDYKERSISTIEGDLLVSGAKTASTDGGGILWSSYAKNYSGIGLLLTILLAILYALLSVRIVRKHYAPL